jgi:hypothetical protein
VYEGVQQYKNVVPGAAIGSHLSVDELGPFLADSLTSMGDVPVQGLLNGSTQPFLDLFREARLRARPGQHVGVVVTKPPETVCVILPPLTATATATTAAAASLGHGSGSGSGGSQSQILSGHVNPLPPPPVSAVAAPVPAPAPAPPLPPVPPAASFSVAVEEPTPARAPAPAPRPEAEAEAAEKYILFDSHSRPQLGHRYDSAYLVQCPTEAALAARLLSLFPSLPVDSSSGGGGFGGGAEDFTAMMYNMFEGSVFQAK